MIGFIKERIFRRKQAAISKKFPEINITLHRDMPSPSMNKMAELARTVSMVNDREERVAAMSDADLRAQTKKFKEEILAKSKEYESTLGDLDNALSAATIPEEKQKVKEKIKNTRNKIFAEILPEAFAVVRETAKRTIGLRHFDVQIAGGIVLHEGRIAEMATGEGKTLVATLPAYLNALLGKGVHIVTVNDYLARRDREWMGPIYEFLGLSVGVIQHGMSDQERKTAYACDITFGTNNEFGFDYLRENMKYRMQDLVQRPFFYAILDEVDSILVDEARTPLIISGPAEESTEKYYIVDKIVPRLKGRIILERDEIDAKYKGEDLSKGFDYVVDERAHTAYLTEEGEAKACAALGIDNLHEIETMEWRHHIIQGLRAHNLYKKDVDYVVKNGQVIIVDEFTGRMMPGRRWSDGLHQAVEAKEKMKIERENQTLATVTFQNYFRMYEKLAGMTGTAFTEANEFKSIYQLDVVVVPTNRTLIRTNYADSIYKTKREKFEGVINEISELYNAGRPILVGTISIDKSEQISEMLKKRGVTHQVLNAKYHEMEAQIVAQAGRFKGVTIATNMAGRGTDILLGGNPEFMARNLIKQERKPEDSDYQEEYKRILANYRKETQEEHEKVVALGGLHVIGTERHEARRIDNQLRGRSGRQGDPGSSRFYVALEDDLMRLFGSERIMGMLDRLGMEEGQVIEHPLITKSIEIAQRRVEQHNFEIRKQLLEYDNVMNKQREVIYTQRRQILEGASLKEGIIAYIEKAINDTSLAYLNQNSDLKDQDIEGLVNQVNLKFAMAFGAAEVRDAEGISIADFLIKRTIDFYQDKENLMGADSMRRMERTVYLQLIDSKWKDHLYAMDNLREGIGLRAFGQRDPLIEYKREAFEMFGAMMSGIEEEAVMMIFKIKPVAPQEVKGVFTSVSQKLLHPQVDKFDKPQEQPPVKRAPQVGPPIKPGPTPPITQQHPKVGRNDPCPCGKIDPRTNKPLKYKKCCYPKYD